MTTGQFIVHIVGWIAFLGHHVLVTSWEKTPVVSIKYLKRFHYYTNSLNNDGTKQNIESEF